MDELEIAEPKLCQAQRLTGETRDLLLRAGVPRRQLADLERVEKILSDFRWKLSQTMTTVA
jgi:hypothetical protein